MVSATQSGQHVPTQLGQIQLVNFPNPAGLQPVGHNLFTVTGASGDPTSGTPGQNGLGSLMQGSLESSNVEVVQEMIGLIRTQRAYEVNSKVVQAADEMLRNATQMR
jgi:flagellar basal-body rod protein FlgG